MEKEGRKDNGVVYILMEDVGHAQQISSACRELGFIAYYFQHLQEIWKSLAQEEPLLLIVDVKLMSDGELLLKDHQCFSSSTMAESNIESNTGPNTELRTRVYRRPAVAFFYSDATEPLLISTNQFIHQGLIKRNNFYENYQRSLQIILGRVRVNFDLTQKITKLEIALGEIKSQNLELKKELLVLREEKKNEMTIPRLLSLKGNNVIKKDYAKKEEDFLTTLADVLNCWPGIKSFSLLILDREQNVLYSPHNRFYEKYIEFNNNNNKFHGSFVKGITPDIQDQILERAIENVNVEGNCFPMLVYGTLPFPEMMVLLVADPGSSQSHQIAQIVQLPYWHILEMAVNYFYQRSSFAVNNRTNVFSSSSCEMVRQLSPWEVLGIISKDYYFQGKKVCMVDLDFTALIEAIKESFSWDFSWEKFINEFLQSFSNECSAGFFASFMGVQRTIFIVEEEQRNTLEVALRKTVKKFPYDKYFDAPDLSMALLSGMVGLFPEVNVLKVPLEKYLQLLEQQ